MKEKNEDRVQFHLSFIIPLHISHKFTHDKNPTLAQKRGQCAANEFSTSTCTPFSKPQSSRVMQGRCLWYWVLYTHPHLNPCLPFNLSLSWNLPSSDVSITPLHLLPPRALLTFLVCFLLLKWSQTCYCVVPHRRTDAAECTWGQLLSGLRGPINYHPLTLTLPSVTLPPVLHVFLRFLGKKCDEWHTEVSLIPT